MLKNTFLSRIKLGRIRWVAVSLISAIILLSITLITNVALASSFEITPKANIPSLALQTTATPTSTLQVGSTSTYSFSLGTLGYDERNLTSPYGTVQYSFRLPEDWAIEADGILDLDLSYVYNQVNAEEYPALFGDLTVTLDDQTLEIFSIDEEFDHYHLQLLLPSGVLDNPDRARHTIELTLNAGYLCEVPHKATLVIYPTSSISLNYSQRPLEFDLSRYPRPFYQQAFEPDIVRFVLPSQPTASDLNNALGVAAKLGDLTSNRLVISATTDIDFAAAPTTFDEHLIVIGQPQDNQVLPLLNDATNLPVSLHQRQFGLVMQGPASVVPGDTYTYLFTITNTVDQDVDLSLIDSLSTQAELIDCDPDCTKNSDDNTVVWGSNLLTPDEVFTLSLTLQVADSFTGTLFENTITLVEADLGPVNADTLTSTIVTDLIDSELQVSVAGENGYFFMHSGRAVPEGDGIIQEFISPWSENRAILIITGLDDEAVGKASQAMSAETHFPGMNGAVALVQEILPSSKTNKEVPVAVKTTFEELGYTDRIIRGISAQETNYWFDIPYGWQLTDKASVDLYFGHSQLIDYEDSELTVLLNSKPVTSVAFSDESSSAGHININLADVDIRPGKTNQLTIQTAMSLSGKCIDTEATGAWLLVKNSSEIHLAHNDVSTPDLNLKNYPYPFHADQSLADLLFIIPDAPTVGEWESALRLAASLGDAATGEKIALIARMDNDLSIEDLDDNNIIVIGRPSRNALIQEINDRLPQPFLPGLDQIDQQLDDVILRLSSDMDLGYLELISSPWNEEYVLLAVTGTTDEGVREAINILTDRSWVLQSGDLVLVRGDEANTIDTRKLTTDGVGVAVATAVFEVAPTATVTIVATTEAMSTPTPPSSRPTPDIPVVEQTVVEVERPTWIIPLVIVTGLVVLAIFIFAFWQARSRRQ